MPIDWRAKLDEITERRKQEAAERAAAKAAGLVPTPIRLTPTGPGYQSIGCPEDGCRWHTHHNDPAVADARYRNHHKEVHGP